MFHTNFHASFTRRDAFRRAGLLGGAALLASLPSALSRAAEPDANSKPAGTAGKQPGYYRFKIGSFDALAVSDGEMTIPLAESPFGLGQPVTEVEKTLEGAYLPSKAVRLAINVLLVRTRTDLVLVDTGSGSLFGPVGGGMLGNLEAAGIKPDDITVVILTHLHGDHFGGLYDAATKQPVFKNARYVMNRREHDFWMNSPDLSKSKLPAQQQEAFIKLAQGVVTGVGRKWELIDPKDRLIEGVEFIDAPGHTPGHMTVAFTSGNDQLIDFADIAHHHAISFVHPEWLLAFDGDPEAAARTRQRMYDRLAVDRARVFGVHMPFPGLGHVRPVDGHYDFVIEPWQFGPPV